MENYTSKSTNPRNRDRHKVGYWQQRNRLQLEKLRRAAHRAVSEYWKKEWSAAGSFCFFCAKKFKDNELELHHRQYFEDSALQSGQFRSRCLEAIAHPERFALADRRCHLYIDTHNLKFLPPDSGARERILRAEKESLKPRRNGQAFTEEYYRWLTRSLDEKAAAYLQQEQEDYRQTEDHRYMKSKFGDWIKD